MSKSNSPLPWQPGLGRGPDSLVNEKLPGKKATWSTAAQLVDLADEYSFYTPGLIYSVMPLNGRDPYVDFCDEIGSVVQPAILSLDKSVFVNFPTVPGQLDWNCHLFALPTDIFTQFVPWIGSLAITDPGQKRLYRVRDRQIEIADQLHVAKTVVLDVAKVPKLTITCFGLDTNFGCYFFRDGLHLLAPVEVLFTKRAFPDTVAFANRLFAESDDPLGAKDRPSQTDIENQVRTARNGNGKPS